MNQSSNCYSVVFFFIFSLCLINSICSIKIKNNITRCDELPKVESNFSLVVEYSPFHVYRSLDPTYNCTTGMGTGPLNGSYYQGTFVIIQNNIVKTMFGVAPTNDNTAMTTFCNNGIVETYHFLVFNVSEVTGYICPYICSDDGASITTIRCYGHNSQDEQQIQAALNKYAINVPGFKNIVNTQSGCVIDFICDNFFF